MPQTLNIAVCEDEAAETVLLCDILNHSDIQNTYTVFTDADSFLASYEHGACLGKLQAVCHRLYRKAGFGS